MEDQTTSIVAAIAGIIGGGGAVKLFELWLNSRKTASDDFQAHWKSLLDEERKGRQDERQEARQKIDELEEALEQVRNELMDQIVKNIRMGSICKD